MKVTLQNVYTCDHCGKKQFRACDMSKHEKWCKENPANKHACFFHCKHLVKGEEEYEGQSRYDSGDTYVGKRTVFTCALTQQKMFSFLAEKRKLPVVNEPDNIRMPLECDKYKDQNEYNLNDLMGGNDIEWY